MDDLNLIGVDYLWRVSEDVDILFVMLPTCSLIRCRLALRYYHLNSDPFHFHALICLEGYVDRWDFSGSFEQFWSDTTPNATSNLNKSARQPEVWLCRS